MEPIDLPRISAAVKEILIAIGEDPDRDGLQDTPDRVARMYAEAVGKELVFYDLENPSDHFALENQESHHATQHTKKTSSRPKLIKV